MILYSKQIGQRLYWVEKYDDGRTAVVSQPINAKTGKPWQKRTFHLTPQPNALMALREFNRALKGE